MISVTLQFTDIAAAAHALARLIPADQLGVTVAAVPSGPTTQPALAPVQMAPNVIVHVDRPDVGASVAQPALPADPVAAAFGGAVVAAAPLLPAAPPSPAQPASIAPSAVTGPTAAPAIERDAAGLPWDARIHASTKTKTKPGMWTAKRNVDAALLAAVEAELRGQPAPAAASAAPQAPAAPNPLAGMPAPATGAALPASPTTFAEVAALIGGHFAGPNSALAQAAFQNALATKGLQHMGQLASPDLAAHIPAIWGEFQRLLAA